jgi:tetratricopeptide (TPR) repeat protein
MIALLTALLFVSHPLATQSVTYIVQRLASLVTLFYLLSLVLYVKARLTDKMRGLKIFLFAGSFISVILAMLTKENAFTLPFAIILFEGFFFQTTKLSINFKDYRVYAVMAAFMAVVIILPLKLTFRVFQSIPPSMGHNYTITPVNYLLTQFSVIVKYIQLLILPVNQKLDYDFPHAYTFFGFVTVLSFLFLAGLIIFGVYLFKKQRIISFGIFWFFLTLSIESGIIPIVDVIYEHRTYLPSFGFFLILSFLFYPFLLKKNKFLAIGFFVILTGINSYLAYSRNEVWKDNLTLWTDNAAKTPNLARPISNRGVAYGTLGEKEQAIADYSKAIELDPGYLIASFNRGVAYGETGQWDKAVTDYTRVLMFDPGHVKAFYNRGLAYANLGQWSKAVEDYSKVIRLESGNTNAFYNRGLAYLNLGLWDKAITDFSETVELDPHYGQAFYTRGIARGNLRQWDQAISDYTQALAINPNSRDIWSNRGVAYSNLGEWVKAIEDYSAAIRIDPAFTTAWYNRGVAYANTKQWDKAIADYSKTLELDPKFTQAYANREFAYRALRLR